ncbi:MAG: hypothetical protein ACRDLL_00375, partial [Solirubrobacterales bacterium]
EVAFIVLTFGANQDDVGLAALAATVAIAAVVLAGIAARAGPAATRRCWRSERPRCWPGPASLPGGFFPVAVAVLSGHSLRRELRRPTRR